MLIKWTKKTYVQILLFCILSILIILTFNFYKSDKIDVKNKKIIVMISGGNIDLSLFNKL